MPCAYVIVAVILEDVECLMTCSVTMRKFVLLHLQNQASRSTKYIIPAIFTVGDSEIALAIINESKTEGEEAKKFLEDVRTTFPQVS